MLVLFAYVDWVHSPVLKCANIILSSVVLGIGKLIDDV